MDNYYHSSLFCFLTVQHKQTIQFVELYTLECPDVDVSSWNRSLHLQSVAVVVGAEELAHIGLVHCYCDVVPVRSYEVGVRLDLVLKEW